MLSVFHGVQEEDLRAMSFVRGEGRQGNKQQLINGLLGFKMKIQKRETREHLYAQYLAVRRIFLFDAQLTSSSAIAAAVHSCDYDCTQNLYFRAV